MAKKKRKNGNDDEKTQPWKKRMVKEEKTAKAKKITKVAAAAKAKRFPAKISRFGKKIAKTDFSPSKKEKAARKAVASGTKRRAKATRGILTAMGVIAGKKKPGRPDKSYKHGMPIHLYKRQLAQRRALYSQFQAEQHMNLRRRGLTKGAIARLQAYRTAEEFGAIEFQEPQTKRPKIQRQPKISHKKGYPQPPPNVADDELRFRKWMADRTVSPRTQQLLTEIRRIQNKGKADNIEQQRRHWERRLVGQSVNLMHAHENMNPIRLDFTGVDKEDNILMAPKTFSNNPEENILRSNRPNVTQTRETGNNISLQDDFENSILRQRGPTIMQTREMGNDLHF